MAFGGLAAARSFMYLGAGEGFMRLCVCWGGGMGKAAAQWPLVAWQQHVPSCTWAQVRGLVVCVYSLGGGREGGQHGTGSNTMTFGGLAAARAFMYLGAGEDSNVFVCGGGGGGGGGGECVCFLCVWWWWWGGGAVEQQQHAHSSTWVQVRRGVGWGGGGGC
jgi:hypothetical protein